MRYIYLDYAATTPVDPVVMRAMEPYYAKKFANPESGHSMGRETFQAVERARGVVAKAFCCEEAGVIFTASATEANNLALRGVVQGIFDQRPLIAKKKKDRAISLPHIITTVIEHDSVFEMCRQLEREEVAEVTYVGVNRDGVVDPADIAKALRHETVIVSVMYANNEIGTIQPIAEISKVIRNFTNHKSQIINKKQILSPLTSYPLFHTDAVQAAQFLDCNMERLGVDLITFSSHKIYGPKGAAALCIRNAGHEKGRKADLVGNKKNSFSTFRFLFPVVVGGGQERGLRSGTQNTPAIVGFGKAIQVALACREKESKRMRVLRDYFIKKLFILNQGKESRKAKTLASTFYENIVTVNGSLTSRLPNNINLSFLGMRTDAIITALDRVGVAVSAGSACATRSAKPSRVLGALAIPEELRAGAVRFSLGRGTTKADLDYVVRVFVKLLRYNAKDAK